MKMMKWRKWHESEMKDVKAKGCDEENIEK
jgi:hypothetical protein